MSERVGAMMVRILAEKQEQGMAAEAAGEKISLLHTEGKDARDVRALEDIFKTQAVFLSADSDRLRLPQDLDNARYVWDKNGRLTELDFTVCGLTGDVSLAGLDALESFYGAGNELSSLDLSRNPALKELDIGGNPHLRALDVSANPALEYLCCDECPIGELDLKQNAALEVLSCIECWLGSLDTSGNPGLRILHCINNRIKNLDFGANPKLTHVSCIDNPVEELDVSKNPLLTCLQCDSGVEIIKEVKNYTEEPER